MSNVFEKFNGIFLFFLRVLKKEHCWHFEEERVEGMLCGCLVGEGVVVEGCGLNRKGGIGLIEILLDVNA